MLLIFGMVAILLLAGTEAGSRSCTQKFDITFNSNGVARRESVVGISFWGHCGGIWPNYNHCRERARDAFFACAEKHWRSKDYLPSECEYHTESYRRVVGDSLRCLVAKKACPALDDRVIDGVTLIAKSDGGGGNGCGPERIHAGRIKCFSVCEPCPTPNEPWLCE